MEDKQDFPWTGLGISTHNPNQVSTSTTTLLTKRNDMMDGWMREKKTALVSLRRRPTDG